MAAIENACTSPETLAVWKASMQQMDRAELMAQQLVQRGAEDALKTLLQIGVTVENCASMLTSLREGLMAIHEVAHARGITLIGYQAPEESDAIITRQGEKVGE